MCGITGFIDFNNKSDKQTLLEMTDTLFHRGPDGHGEELYQVNNCQVGFGHRRLSIIDLSNHAAQPMAFDGLHIVFNGEIYNYQEIKEQLVTLGHKFETSSDTEVILHAWRQWGTTAIAQWHGMFAIALFDEKTNEIFLIRDRAGVKPLYYYSNNNVILFGSELKPLLKHPAFTKKINKNAVAGFLQYGYVAWPYCIFENTSKVSPGHYLNLKIDGNVQSEVRYWNVYDHYNKPKLSITLPDAITETEKILKKAFDYRMVADVPVGVFLSGGYDSTCVTALLQKDSAEKIKTFTIGTTDSKLDEAPFAKEIAGMLGTDHTEYYCSPKEALDIIPKLPFFYDEPFADSSAIPTILVSTVAKKTVTVALSADAGDEIFAGYNRYDYVARYISKINAIPPALRKIGYMAMNSISSQNIPVLKHKHNFHGRYGKLKNLLNDPSPNQLLKNLTQVFTLTEINQLFNTEIQELNSAHNAKRIEGLHDELSYMMAVDYQTYLSDDILQKVDRAAMSVSLEGREPFLDQDIIEWAAQLPTDFKYRNGHKKFILKEIVHKYIPQKIMDRPKMGFALPIEKWLSHELKELVLSNLNETNLNNHGLFNTKVVLNIVNKFYAGHKEMHLQIWYLLMFQMWYDHWM